ncbi:hypothetical protein MVES_000088 [Malassezia vespertilionis]|uniref:Phospholipid/glycerol acyltransferase domain-containing protein n=2 Tax=Malassezia vespertilionis TaxID=2020962 RepID=A0A2N1JHE1_9BASI|nr:hypothetical protein MVES_000088 [Malassezia vespertilionis]
MPQQSAQTPAVPAANGDETHSTPTHAQSHEAASNHVLDYAAAAQSGTAPKSTRALLPPLFDIPKDPIAASSRPISEEAVMAVESALGDESADKNTSASRQASHGTLAYTRADLYRFLASLPFPVHKILPRVLVNSAARVLLLRRLLATEMAYDVLLLFWRGVVNLFFREVQPRSAYQIPREGPVIFVAAPHHNQFLDPLLLASEVRSNSGRRVSFLIAQKSLDRKFIGTMARMFQSIPVSRAADYAKAGRGTVGVTAADATLLQGCDTEFTKQAMVRGQILLSKETEYAAAEVVEILSDTELRIKAPFINNAAVELLQSRQGAEYKCLPFVDQQKMYTKVFDCLSENGCIGIFPEGGSHDRTDLLPLKAGVVVMALGAIANNPALNVKIVPVGMSYFHPHKFRSRAVVEFGKPLSVPHGMVEMFKRGGAEKRKAITDMLDMVYDGIKSVTIRAPDYETLMVIQAGRRLIKVPGQRPSLGDVVRLNRLLIMGYLRCQDHPSVVRLRKAVLTYNDHLKQVGIRDHQVERANRSAFSNVVLLLYRLGMLTVWTTCALPGAVLNAPIIILAKVVSKIKAKEALAASQVKLKGRDVLATWKVLVSLVVTPILYMSYAGIATAFVWRKPNVRLIHKRLMPLYVLIGLPCMAYSTLKFSEVGIDVYKSLPPLLSSLVPGRRKVVDALQQERQSLAEQMYAVIEELGPDVFNMDDIHMQTPSASAPPPDEQTQDTMLFRGRTLSERGSLSHPLTFIDELVFGWGSARRQRDSEYETLLDEDNVNEAEMHDVVQAGLDQASEKRRRRSNSQDYRLRRSPLAEVYAFSSANNNATPK